MGWLDFGGQGNPDDLLINAGRRSNGQIFDVNPGFGGMNAGSDAVPGTGGAWGGGVGNFLFGSESNGVKTGGAAMPLLQGAASLFGAWNGMKQLSLGKKQLREQTRQFDLNFSAQKNLLNNQIYDRQVARNAASPQMGYMSPDEAMAKWGVK